MAVNKDSSNKSFVDRLFQYTFETKRTLRGRKRNLRTCRQLSPRDFDIPFRYYFSLFLSSRSHRIALLRIFFFFFFFFLSLLHFLHDCKTDFEMFQVSHAHLEKVNKLRGERERKRERKNKLPVKNSQSLTDHRIDQGSRRPLLNTNG